MTYINPHGLTIKVPRNIQPQVTPFVYGVLNVYQRVCNPHARMGETWSHAKSRYMETQKLSINYALSGMGFHVSKNWEVLPGAWEFQERLVRSLRRDDTALFKFNQQYIALHVQECFELGDGYLLRFSNMDDTLQLEGNHRVMIHT